MVTFLSEAISIATREILSPICDRKKSALRRTDEPPPTMAPLKKASGSGKTRSSSSMKEPTLKRVKGENFYRDAKAASRLKMLNGGKPVRDKNGRITQAAAFQKGEDETTPGRVQPDRRWFGESLYHDRVYRNL